MKRNLDYTEPLLVRGERMVRRAESKHENMLPNHHRPTGKLWGTLRDLLPLMWNSRESLIPQAYSDDKTNNYALPEEVYKDLSRNPAAEQDVGDLQHEYAIVSTIVDSPSIQVDFYWDVGGPIPAASSHNDSDGSQIPNLSPEYGINLSVDGGIVQYGPWADRQRIGLQNMFIPRLYKDSEARIPPKPGQLREPDEFKIFIEFLKPVTMRVPIREESKDWKYNKSRPGRGSIGSQSDAPLKPKFSKRSKSKSKSKSKPKHASSGVKEVRPFGWLEVKISENSTVSYDMNMFAMQTGWHNRLNLDLRNLEVWSSVNHGLLLKAKSQTVSADLSNPLKWNGYSRWQFDSQTKQGNLFLLREHITLLTDLVSDWAVGPPQDYYTFTPIDYHVNIGFTDFQCFLNVNDANIIDKPADLDDNTYVKLFGQSVTSRLSIPLSRFQAQRNQIDFDADIPMLKIALQAPQWNTHETFLDSEFLGFIADLNLKGSYDYFSTSGVDLVDTLTLDILAQNGEIEIFGFIARLFMKIKDNYFGDDVRYRTLEEFRTEQIENTAPREHVGGSSAAAKKANDLDVILSARLKAGRGFIPKGLYRAHESIGLITSGLCIDLRFTNHYMDLQVDIEPIRIAAFKKPQNTMTAGLSWELKMVQPPEVYIDSVAIFGHRLFGLPPTEPTYICNWDFDIGDLKGEISPRFLQGLVLGLQSFVFTFVDVENILPKHMTEVAVIHDITFLRLRLQSIALAILLDEEALKIQTGEIVVSFNDWADEIVSERVSVKIPAVALTMFRSKETANPIDFYCDGETSLDIALYLRNKNSSDAREKQQQHLVIHDRPTNRAEFLIQRDASANSIHFNPERVEQNRNAPPLPVPMVMNQNDDNSVSDESLTSVETSERSSVSVVHQRAFLLSSLHSSKKSGPRTANSTSTSIMSRSLKTKPISRQTGNDMSQDDDLSSQNSRPSHAHSVDTLGPFDAPEFWSYGVRSAKLDTNISTTNDDAVHPNIDRSDLTNIIKPFINEEENKTIVVIKFGTGNNFTIRPQAINCLLNLVQVFQPRVSLLATLFSLELMTLGPGICP